MATEPETCPCCRRYTQRGRQQLAVQFRSMPVYGTDMTKPLSELVAGIRADLVKARGQLTDISMGFTGWRDRLEDVEGLLTCGISVMYGIVEEMRRHEIANAATTDDVANNGTGD